MGIIQNLKGSSLNFIKLNTVNQKAYNELLHFTDPHFEHCVFSALNIFCYLHTVPDTQTHLVVQTYLFSFYLFGSHATIDNVSTCITTAMSLICK